MDEWLYYTAGNMVPRTATTGRRASTLSQFTHFTAPTFLQPRQLSMDITKDVEEDVCRRITRHIRRQQGAMIEYIDPVGAALQARRLGGESPLRAAVTAAVSTAANAPLPRPVFGGVFRRAFFGSWL